MPSTQVIFFMITAVLAVTTAIVTVTRKNPVSAAVALILHFFTLAGLYLTLQAQFIAVIQVLVYAGAIMVLVVFVIMLLNLGREENLTEKFNVRSVIGSILGGLLVVQILIVVGLEPSKYTRLHSQAHELGTAESIGTVLFSQYLFPFEAISLLLLAAIIGSVIIAKRKVES